MQIGKEEINLSLFTEDMTSMYKVLSNQQNNLWNYNWLVQGFVIPMLVYKSKLLFIYHNDKLKLKTLYNLHFHP